MSDVKPSAKERLAAAVTEGTEPAFALEMGRRMLIFFNLHSDVAPLDLSDHSILKFKTWSFADGSHRTQAVIHVHDKRANYVAECPEDHERVQTWFVLGEGASTPMLFEDDMAEDHRLEDEGKYPELVAHREVKDIAIAAGAYLQPIDTTSLDRLAKLLRFADARLAG